MADMGISIGGAAVTPGLVTLPDRIQIRLTARSVLGTRRGRARYVIADSDPWTMNNGRKEVVGTPFDVTTGGTVINQDILIDDSDEAGLIVLNIFVGELAGGDEDNTSVTIGARAK